MLFYIPVCNQGVVSHVCYANSLVIKIIIYKTVIIKYIFLYVYIYIYHQFPPKKKLT